MEKVHAATQRIMGHRVTIDPYEYDIAGYKG